MVHLAKEVDFEKSKCELGIGLTGSFVHSLHWSKLETRTGQSLLLFCLKGGSIWWWGKLDGRLLHQPACEFHCILSSPIVLKVVCLLVCSFLVFVSLNPVRYFWSTLFSPYGLHFVYNIPYGTIFHFHLQGEGVASHLPPPHALLPRPVLARATIVSPFPTFPPPCSVNYVLQYHTGFLHVIPYGLQV